MSVSARPGTLLPRFLQAAERTHPRATGELSALLSQVALAGKRIARVLSRTGLADGLDAVRDTVVDGEEPQKLDVLAKELFLESFSYGPLVPWVVTEEMALPARQGGNEASGKYAVFLDPLDASSTLDVNAAVGSVFSVRRLVGDEPLASEDDLLARVSQEQVVAGYLVYGPSTMLVYTAGARTGVHGFTLDPGIGEFLLSHPEIRIPRRGRYVSANEAASATWAEGPRRFLERLRVPDASKGRPYGSRYSGALVSDVHRLLLKGGLFLHPEGKDALFGKLQLLYEAAPMAAVVEAAGGAASDGRRRILDVFPESNRQRTALYIGSRDDVEELEATLAGFAS